MDGIGGLEPVVGVSLAIVDTLHPIVVVGVHLAIGRLLTGHRTGGDLGGERVGERVGGWRACGAVPFGRSPANFRGVIANGTLRLLAFGIYLAGFPKTSLSRARR